MTLYLFEQLRDKLKISQKDELHMIKMALMHDTGELVDLPHEYKEKCPEMRELSDKMELVEVERLLGEKYKNILAEYNENNSLAACIVEIGDVATVDAGLGVTAFCAMVVLTMFAANSFDTRLIWDNYKDNVKNED